MPHLHLHVISQDFDNIWLKQPKHVRSLVRCSLVDRHDDGARSGTALALLTASSSI